MFQLGGRWDHTHSTCVLSNRDCCFWQAINESRNHRQPQKRRSRLITLIPFDSRFVFSASLSVNDASFIDYRVVIKAVFLVLLELIRVIPAGHVMSRDKTDGATLDAGMRTESSSASCTGVAMMTKQRALIG